ncbi:MAG: PEP-CTERM system histidine kinase PrsK [Sphingobium sp.]|nr:PEP-CTERM system histidine kinase PrsK [Sphingobium sp.]
MGPLLQIIGDGGHALAAALFAALGIIVLRRREGALLATALLMTSCWALYISFGGVARPLSGLVENIRNAAWLLMMFVMLRRGEGRQPGPMLAVGTVYAAVAALIALQCFVDLSWRQVSPDSDLHLLLVQVSLVLHMMTAIGALVLVHNLYSLAAPAGRERIALLMGALAAMWTYDLNLYAIGYFAIERATELYALRGPLMALLAPIMAIALYRGDGGPLRLSRTVTFQSLSIVAVGLYIVALGALIALIELVAGPMARQVEIGGMFMSVVVALLLLPSSRFRARIKMHVAQHFFQHRYDYRLEWMRFGDTIGRPGDQPAPLGVRAVKAVADITQSPGGLLLLRDEAGGLSVETGWNWPEAAYPHPAVPREAVAALEAAALVVDLDRVRGGDARIALPEWMTTDERIWALAPLIHFDRMIGAILLARPPVDRRLDWEDFDMLSAAGRQVATYISEAQGQRALDDAQRFDEFNRRFAFIIHDVKNLVSQLSLLARNAQRHADNPDFRADMVLTLQESVGKMNDLLARLSHHSKARAEEPRAVRLDAIVAAIARGRAGQHRIETAGAAPDALADPARVEQILTHLVQNAIDASAPDSPVRLRLRRQDDWAMVDVIDQGCGMTAEYMRRDLFKPFSSSKPGGFGIGAFEARALAEAMGGRIEVESRVGVGSRFTLVLPTAGTMPGMLTGKAA